MPQLDRVTFLSQFFWLSIFFLSFYIVSIKHFLPQMSRLLKYRKKRLEQSSFQGQGSSAQLQQESEGGKGTAYASGQGMHNSTQEESSRVRESVDELLENGLKSSKNVLDQSIKATEMWLSGNTTQINQNKLKNVNVGYLHSLGERSLSERLSLQGGFHDFSSKLWLSVLMRKLTHSKSKRLRQRANLRSSPSRSKGNK